MHKTTHHLLALVAASFAWASCSQGVSVNNGNPTGTVGGVILDGTTEAPLAGAMITVVAGDKTLTATTDMNGQFAVGKVPAGTFIMTVAQMGYVGAQITDMLAGSVGNFPVQDPQHTVGPIGLLPSGGTFTVHVVDETGAPVPSLKLSARTAVREILYNDGQPFGQGAYQVTATTGMDGAATFMGLPEFAGLVGVVDDTFVIAVPPTKVMGTDSYDFLGATFPFHLSALTSSAQIIHLAGPQTALAILDSNIEYLRGRTAASPTAFTAPVGSIIPINGPITVAYNQAIDQTSLRAQFLDASGQLMATTAMTSINLNLVSITPSAPLPAGKRFNLILHAVAATSAGSNPTGGSELDVTAPFFSAPPAGAPITVIPNSVTNNGAATGPIVVSFELSEPIGVGFGNNAPLDCVAFYEVGGPNAPGFNNDPQTVFQGDWKSTASSTPPTNLVCRQAVGTGLVGAPQINVTALTSLETNNATTTPTVITGFSSKFSITIAQAPTNMNAGPCKQIMGGTTFPGCAIPGTGTKVHLIFSRQDSTTTVKRVDGTTVPDSIIVQL